MSSLTSSPYSTLKPLPLIPNRRMSVDIDDTNGLPFGAGEPKFYHGHHSKLGSAHSLLENSAHETHMFAPFDPRIPRTSSPAQLSSSSTWRKSSATRMDVLLYLFRKTSTWVFVGVALMLMGIGLTQAVVLPKIHSCPISATCPGSFDPNTGNSLQLLQSFMTYWLKAGLMVASIGILKLSAYQAWFIVLHKGNTVKNLDLCLGAIRGSVVDACFLLLRKNNRLFSSFVFGLVGIGALISLITGLSIEKVPGTRVTSFRFNGTSELPNSSLLQLNNDGQLLATQKVIKWALQGDDSHEGAMKGTLVVPGPRSIQGSNVIPEGPRITGRFECQGWDDYTFVENLGEWHISLKGKTYIANRNMSLSTSFVNTDTAVTNYLWVSNTAGLLPNATQTSDGGMNIAFCTHWLSMVPEEKKSGPNYLVETVPVTSGCAPGSDSNTCVADSVNNAIINWWGGKGTAFWHITCRGGVLGPVPSQTDTERYCPITQERWKATATSMLDAIMQTAPQSVLTDQDLEAVVENLNQRRWWLHAVIPGATVGLYIVGLVYTCMLSEGDKMLKELNLEEVVKAAQTDHMHDVIAAGQLRRTVVRYDSDVGFVNSHAPPVR